MATAAQTFQTGDVRVRDGWEYQRQEGGAWTPVRPVSGEQAQAIQIRPADPTQGLEVRREEIGVQRDQLALDKAREERAAAEAASTAPDFADENALRTQFESRPEVQRYMVSLSPYYGALTAGDNRAGDLNLVYGVANLLDPGAVVRESDSILVQQTASLDERTLGAIRTITGGGELTPATRAQLREELRKRGRALGGLYGRQRQHYADLARRYNFDPSAIVGDEHPERAVQNQLGINRYGQPLDRGIFMFNDEEPETVGDPQFEADLLEELRRGRITSPEQVVEFGKQRNWQVSPESAQQALEHFQGGGGLSRPQFERPDISGARGNGGLGETVDAGVRGAANTLALGFDDEISAGLGTLFGGGSFRENLMRERTIDEFDENNNFGARLTGQLTAGLGLPTGASGAARSAAAQVAANGGSRIEALAAARSAAARRLGGEGAAFGGAYGIGSGEGDALDRIANGAVDAAFGATVGALGGRIFGAGGVPRERSALPALVDPQTGRLNQPLESALPAERVAAARALDINLPAGAAGGRTAAIMEKGLDILPASAGVMEDGRRVLGGEVENALERVAGQYGDAQGLYAAGQSAQSGASNWITRFERVSGKAYDAISISPRAQASLENTRSELDRLTTTFESNPELAEIMRNPRLTSYRDALQEGSLSWDDLKALRSRIGYEIGEQRFSDSPTRDELRSLYGALSEDMRATAAAQGPAALRQFERANNLYRQGQQRIDNALVAILGDNSKNNPEAAGRTLQTIIRSGRGNSNLDQLRHIRRSMDKGEEWNEVASSLIRLMGQPVNSTGREFSPQTFVQNYADMSEPARNLLFADRGRKDLREALDSFVAVNQRLAATNSLRNTSQTAPGLTAAGTVTSLIAPFVSLLWNPMVGVKVAAGMGANYGAARLWTWPGFVRWATGYNRMLARSADQGSPPTQQQIRQQRSSLLRLIRTDPAIGAEASPLAESLGALEEEGLGGDGGSTR